MFNKFFSLGIVVIALIILSLSIVSTTFSSKDDLVSAAYEVPSSSSPAIIVTDPGALELVNSHVQLKIDAPPSVDISIAIGRNPDIISWIGETKYSRITGLRSWTELDHIDENVNSESGEITSEKTASGALLPFVPGQKIDITSDMWEYSVSQFGEVNVDWSKINDETWSALIIAQNATNANDGAENSEMPQVKITLIWEKANTHILQVIGIVVSSIMILGILIMQMIFRLNSRKGSHAGESKRLVDYVGQKTGEFALPKSSQIPVISRANLQSLIPDNNSQYIGAQFGPSDGIDYYTGVASYDDYSQFQNNDVNQGVYYDANYSQNYDDNYSQNSSFNSTWQYYGEDESGEQYYEAPDEGFSFYSNDGEIYSGGLQRQLNPNNTQQFIANDSISQLTQSAIQLSDSLDVQHKIAPYEETQQFSRKELRQKGKLWRGKK